MLNWRAYNINISSNNDTRNWHSRVSLHDTTCMPILYPHPRHHLHAKSVDKNSIDPVDIPIVSYPNPFSLHSNPCYPFSAICQLLLRAHASIRVVAFKLLTDKNQFSKWFDCGVVFSSDFTTCKGANVFKKLLQADVRLNRIATLDCFVPRIYAPLCC